MAIATSQPYLMRGLAFEREVMGFDKYPAKNRKLHNHQTTHFELYINFYPFRICSPGGKKRLQRGMDLYQR